ncbi:hypothetical protein HDU76_012599 [Blyttiomyces sp. JEL0837]|nr:hypothetical protein HDU76_012599 [Blyttiomyces sp. JEL0837]
MFNLTAFMTDSIFINDDDMVSDFSPIPSPHQPTRSPSIPSSTHSAPRAIGSDVLGLNYEVLDTGLGELNALIDDIAHGACSTSIDITFDESSSALRDGSLNGEEEIRDVADDDDETEDVAGNTSDVMPQRSESEENGDDVCDNQLQVVRHRLPRETNGQVSMQSDLVDGVSDEGTLNDASNHDTSDSKTCSSCHTTITLFWCQGRDLKPVCTDCFPKIWSARRSQSQSSHHHQTATTITSSSSPSSSSGVTICTNCGITCQHLTQWVRGKDNERYCNECFRLHRQGNESMRLFRTEDVMGLTLGSDQVFRKTRVDVGSRSRLLLKDRADFDVNDMDNDDDDDGTRSAELALMKTSHNRSSRIIDSTPDDDDNDCDIDNDNVEDNDQIESRHVDAATTSATNLIPARRSNQDIVIQEPTISIPLRRLKLLKGSWDRSRLTQETLAAGGRGQVYLPANQALRLSRELENLNSAAKVHFVVAELGDMVWEELGYS